MKYRIPEEIIKKTINYGCNYSCLEGSKLYPFGTVAGSRPGSHLVVEGKYFEITTCAYHYEVRDKNGSIINVCSCPVRCELFKQYGK